MLFNFQEYGDFSTIFLLSLSNLIPLWPKNVLCVVLYVIFSIVKFVS